MEAQKETSFIQELEERLNVIFAEEEKPKQAAAAADVADTSILDSVNMTPGEEGRDELFGDLDESSSIMFSHIKELKSIVLSLEWEINGDILARFDEEVLRLEEIYTEDLYSLALIRILRFLGRYIREKNTEAEPRSINLLLSTYDNLENVLLSRSMPEAGKYSLMQENIGKYRQWVETVDLSMPEKDGEEEAPAPAGRPALQLLVGKQEKDHPQPEVAEEEVEKVSPVEQSASDLFKDSGFGDGQLQRMEAAVDDENTDARIFEDDPVRDKVPAFAGPNPLDEIRADDIFPAGVRPDGIPEDGDFETNDALASALERIRQEIRSEIMAEVRAEIRALRDEIRSMRDS
jgi:hypothetical protein